MTEKNSKQYRSIFLRLEPEIYESLAALAKSQHRSAANLAEFCVIQYIQNHSSQPHPEDKTKGAVSGETAPPNTQSTNHQPKTVAKNRNRRSLS